AGAGGHRGWSGPHRILQGLSLRHGGPSLLHQGRRGAEDLAAGPRLGLPAASAPVADLLRRAVLPLSTQAAERAGRPGSLARPARRAELSALATLPLHGGADLRAVGDESLRPPSLPDVLQDLHREGVGHSVLRAGGGGRRGAEGIEIRGPGRRVDGGVVTGPRGEEPVRGDQFLSSMPVTELVLRLSPPAPDAVREAARRLTYRDFLTVCLIVDRPGPFPDTWIYVHSPAGKVGRIQNFRSWSPDMVPDPTKGSLGLEYFCSEGDALWTMADGELIRLGKEELEGIGLARASEISDDFVFRVPKAYPVYDADYREHLDTVRGFVDGLENLQTIGRNGLHRYNNQDHAMLTGLLAVRNLEGGARHDLWSVNTEPEYHEEIGISDAEAAMLDGRVTEIFPRVDGVAFGAATGLVAGALLCLATLVLVWKGGPVVGPTLGLLAQFLP